MRAPGTPPRSLARLGAVALLAAFAGCAPDSPPGATCAPPPSSACAPDPTPLRRLTPHEYVNTARDLLDVLDFDAQTLAEDAQIIADPGVDGFDGDATAQTPSPLLLEQYGIAAGNIADAVLPGATTLTGCAPRSRASERACGERFVRSFGRRAFRRPLADAEIARFDAFFEARRAEHGFSAAVAAFVEGLLQSPSFLYRPEFGEQRCAAAGAVPLTGWEVASRLSYLLWASMPDDALFLAAERGELADVAHVESHARRMLADPRARDGISEITRQWLGLSALDGIYKDQTVFPSFTLPRARLMKEATLQWVDHWFWDEGGTLPGLFTDTHAYADPWLAGVYGVAPNGEDLALVDLDPAQRSGLLTQAGLLAALAHPTMTSPVKRGVYVLDRLFCESPPPPPPSVNTAIPAATTGAQTMRQRMDEHVAGECQGCHASIDGIGFGLEQYDALGQWQTTDMGLPVDASGAIEGGDAAGAFDGAVELSARLASSRDVAACVGRMWFHHGFGRTDTAGDACTLATLQGALDASGGDLRELLVAIATSDAFRYRAAAGGAR